MPSARARRRSFIDACARRPRAAAYSIARSKAVSSWRVGHQPHPRQRVPDLGAFEEAQAAVHAVRHLVRTSRVFLEQRAIARWSGTGSRIRRMAARPRAPTGADALDHEARLLDFGIEGRIQTSIGSPRAAVGPQLTCPGARDCCAMIALAAARMFAGGAVILFEPHACLRAGEIAQEAAARSRPWPRASRRSPGRRRRPRTLGAVSPASTRIHAYWMAVGVLELVDQEVLEAMPR